MSGLCLSETLSWRDSDEVERMLLFLNGSVFFSAVAMGKPSGSSRSLLYLAGGLLFIPGLISAGSLSKCWPNSCFGKQDTWQ